jgi:4-amino-4-deoxychorismate lyase
VEQHPLVAVLGAGVVPADTPVLRADDFGVLRGDGAFEAMHVRGGRPWLLAEHLDRLDRSARLLDLPLPPREALTGLVDQICAPWPASTEGALRIVCTRGAEHGDGRPTVFATLGAVSAERRRARQTGVTAVTATLGHAVGAKEAAPWLLAGAKTLSYAVNMASQRWAASRAADEVLWVSVDGYALEAPTASLVWLAGDTLCTVPAPQTGILPGITVRWLLDHAGKLGWSGEERLIRPAELSTVDGVWLVSSVRGLVAIRTLDGAPLPSSPHTATLGELLGHTV